MIGLTYLMQGLALILMIALVAVADAAIRQRRYRFLPLHFFLFVVAIGMFYLEWVIRGALR